MRKKDTARARAPKVAERIRPKWWKVRSFHSGSSTTAKRAQSMVLLWRCLKCLLVSCSSFSLSHSKRFARRCSPSVKAATICATSSGPERSLPKMCEIMLGEEYGEHPIARCRTCGARQPRAGRHALRNHAGSIAFAMNVRGTSRWRDNVSRVEKDWMLVSLGDLLSKA